jgi:hypothetical protein
LIRVLFIVVFFCSLFSVAFGDSSTQQSVMFSVTPTNQIGPIVGPSPIFSLQGKDGNCENCINNYSLVTNEENKKVIAYLDKNLPKGCTFTANLSPPPQGRSMGTQLLSTTPVDLLVEVSKVSQTDLVLTYVFAVTVEAGVISGSTCIVTFVMTDG